MDVPDSVTSSRLWSRISDDRSFVDTLLGLRRIAAAIGSQAERTIPEYTDHSVRHMDALWWVSDQVLSESECARVTPAEGFILGSSFYVHDLGMAFAATADAVAEIRRTRQYLAAFNRLVRVYHLADARADILAIRIATREIHAQKALDLVSLPLPGIGRYLIEQTEMREAWSHTIGQVAASHHWDLEQVHRRLGVRNAVPTADRGTADLGFIACALRIIDYAHINRERASNLDRALRSDISADSVVHWDAQSNITGPIRKDDLLLYGCTAPIDDVDAWWLFYELASGLDTEITSVREYLRGRAVSGERFTLQGVSGIETPQTFVRLVQLAGDTAPIDIRVQPHSMERLVELLGGQRLYGSDVLAPLRELIQNSRDAIELRRAVERAEHKPETPGQIIVSLDEVDGASVLSVKDNGVGMTRSVVVRHLIAVGSDFWHSAEFYRDFGTSLDAGFSPIGKFGIGFLSVFMFGDRVEVKSEAVNSRITLRLRGVGRRGELRQVEPSGDVGTEVTIVLKPEIAERLTDLFDVVRARAPMLQVPIVVRTRRGSSIVERRLDREWWKHIEDDALLEFSATWATTARRGKETEQDAAVRRRRAGEYYFDREEYGMTRYRRADMLTGWPGLKPTLNDKSTRVISTGNDQEGGVIRCSQGIAVDRISIGDIAGIVEVGEIELTASRSAMMGYEEQRHASEYYERGVDASTLRLRLIDGLRPDVVSKLNELERYGLIPARIDFLRRIGIQYGSAVLRETSLRWIPVLEPPGNLIHQSSAGLLESLKQQDRVVLACGVGPASAYSVPAASIPLAELSQMLAVAIRPAEVEIEYFAGKDLQRELGSRRLEAPLDEILDRIPKGRKNLVLIGVLVAIVADAWAMQPAEIRAQMWSFDIEDNVLWAGLTRRTA